MGLIRLLLLLFLVWLVWWLLKPLFTKHDRPISGQRAHEVEDMVRCAWCGLNLPAGEALRAGGHYYCNDEHRRLHQEQNPDAKS